MWTTVGGRLGSGRMPTLSNAASFRQSLRLEPCVVLGAIHYFDINDKSDRGESCKLGSIQSDEEVKTSCFGGTTCMYLCFDPCPRGAPQIWISIVSRCEKTRPEEHSRDEAMRQFLLPVCGSSVMVTPCDQLASDNEQYSKRFASWRCRVDIYCLVVSAVYIDRLFPAVETCRRQIDICCVNVCGQFLQRSACCGAPRTASTAWANCSAHKFDFCNVAMQHRTMWVRVLSVWSQVS